MIAGSVSSEGGGGGEKASHGGAGKEPGCRVAVVLSPQLRPRRTADVILGFRRVVVSWRSVPLPTNRRPSASRWDTVHRSRLEASRAAGGRRDNNRVCGFAVACVVIIGLTTPSGALRQQVRDEMSQWHCLNQQEQQVINGSVSFTLCKQGIKLHDIHLAF
mgnify:CR=1 FL=1